MKLSLTIALPGTPFYDSAHLSPQALSSWIRSQYNQRVYYQLGAVSYLDLLTHIHSQRRYYDSAVSIVPVIKDFINPFSTNVPLIDKPGSWFLLAKCLKYTCGRVTF